MIKTRGLRTMGGIAAVLSLLFIVADIFIGTALGGDLTALPQSAAGRSPRIAWA